jgi:hypothetical protein
VEAVQHIYLVMMAALSSKHLHVSAGIQASLSEVLISVFIARRTSHILQTSLFCMLAEVSHSTLMSPHKNTEINYAVFSVLA